MITHNSNINTKIMNNMINLIHSAKKIGALTALILALFVTANIQAQTTDDTDAGLIRDAGDGVSVKLIDNKGTIKYLQTNNGITSITSTTAGSATTTTWQLGGALTDDTYIDADGSVFSLDGLKLETGTAATTATTQSGHAASASGSTTLSTDTGWTVVVRDEATGELRKILASDLVDSGYAADTAAADGTITITATGIPALMGNEGKISVYRNGAKLVNNGTDFTVATGTSVTIANTADFDIYTGDVFEVQWIN